MSSSLRFLKHLSLKSLLFCGVFMLAANGCATAYEASASKDASDTGVNEVELVAAGPSGPLKGSFIKAENARAAAIILPGSGAIDRNGDSPPYMGSSTYKLLAEGLAEKGVSSLRADKRGLFGSAGAGDANAVTIGAYVEDLKSWIAVVRETAGVECVWLIGHSEGGLIATKAAAEATQGVCGIALVAAPGQPVGRLLEYQLRINPSNAEILDRGLEAIKLLEAGETIAREDLPEPLQAVFRPEIQLYLIDLFSHDPAQLLSGYEGPVLIMSGDKDLQVPIDDAEKLAKSSKQAELHLIFEMNHMLRTITSDDLGENYAAYSNPDLPLSAGVVPTLARFITEH